jgi:hypothetical protein
MDLQKGEKNAMLCQNVRRPRTFLHTPAPEFGTAIEQSWKENQ